MAVSTMEWCPILAFSKPTLFPPKLNMHKLGFITHHDHTIWKQQQQRSAKNRFHCHKMYVPGFFEASPEAKAANNLHNFFTYVAVKIVTAQLQSYNTEAYAELMEFINRHSLNDGDKFCASLMRESSRHKTLALRILEVRSAYCKSDFEWDNLRRLATKRISESNTNLMRDYVLETSHVESEKGNPSSSGGPEMV